jgi:hypothetical protein
MKKRKPLAPPKRKLRLRFSHRGLKAGYLKVTRRLVFMSFYGQFYGAKGVEEF